MRVRACVLVRASLFVRVVRACVRASVPVCVRACVRVRVVRAGVRVQFELIRLGCRSARRVARFDSSLARKVERHSGLTTVTCRAQVLRITLHEYARTMGKAAPPDEPNQGLPVQVYVMGAEEWRAYADWPPTSTTSTWLLGEASPGRGALLREGEESAAAGGPGSDLAGYSEYVYDPADPTPSRGGASFNPFNMGSVDQVYPEPRPISSRRPLNPSPRWHILQSLPFLLSLKFLRSLQSLQDGFN